MHTESAIKIPDLPEPTTNHISNPDPEIPKAITQEADTNGEHAITHISRRQEFDDQAAAAQAATM